jgi:hypothetical protein
MTAFFGDGIAACAWRSVAKAGDLSALKWAKREIDHRLIGEASELTAALIQRLRGEPAADAITCVPCGHSRRPDCFGKRLAQGVAELLGLPFVQVFADRFCTGVSHPKYSKLPPLEQIADPVASMLLIDDLATSGWPVEEALTTLCKLGASASAFV